MAEEFCFAVVDEHGGHVLDPIATIQVAGIVTLQGQVEWKVPVPKHKHINRFVFRGRQPVQTVLQQVFLSGFSEGLIAFGPALS